MAKTQHSDENSSDSDSFLKKKSKNAMSLFRTATEMAGRPNPNNPKLLEPRRVMSIAPTMNDNFKISMNYFTNDNQRGKNGKPRLCETYLTVCRLLNEVVM